jgi:hypothetical protein
MRENRTYGIDEGELEIEHSAATPALYFTVPGVADSLPRTFNTIHMQYAQYYNQKREAKGHLWQGQFFSYVLDERYTYLTADFSK